ncbi:Phosphate transport regulator [Candidatus Nitrosotalea sp. FS]|nr:Phosphate transport regulator [Candidatus Nitrosotalea sp. FS]
MKLRMDYMAQWMSWIKSNDKEIIAILNDLASKAEESAKLLVELFVNFDKLNEIHSQIEKIEKEADKLTHSVFEELNKTFITPLDREDISRIASKTDDIIDYIDGIVGRIIGFKIKSPPPHMLEIAKEIHNSTKEINLMITRLNKVKADKSLIEHCRAINEQEHRVDVIYRKAIGELFETTDVINIIKMKDTYEALEHASDRCLDVADSIEDIVLKYT